jgi:hypothetical protein
MSHMRRISILTGCTILLAFAVADQASARRGIGGAGFHGVGFRGAAFRGSVAGWRGAGLGWRRGVAWRGWGARRWGYSPVAAGLAASAYYYRRSYPYYGYGYAPYYGYSYAGTYSPYSYYGSYSPYYYSSGYYGACGY